MTFGTYIRSKRKAIGLKLKDVSSAIDLSITYLHDIETERRNPPDGNTLKLLSAVLNLSTADEIMLYDLAALARPNTVPIDIADYIMEHPNLRAFIRKAKNINLSNDDWNNFISVVNK